MNLHSKKFLFFVLTLATFFFGFDKVNAATYTWDGGGGDNNWSTAANWSSDIVPTSADAVVFNSTSVKDSTIDGSFAGTVAFISVNSGYSGTITTARNATTTGNFTIASGTFNAGGYSFGIGGDTGGNKASYTQTGGTFIAPGSGKYFPIYGDMTISSGTFTHNSGTVTFKGSWDFSQTINAPSVTFNLVNLLWTDTCRGGYEVISSGTTIPLGNSPTTSVCNSLTVNGTITVGSGTWTYTGNLIINSGGAVTSSGLTASITGGLTVNSGASFQNNMTITFGSGDGTISAPGVTFTKVIFNTPNYQPYYSGYTISAGTNIPLGTDPTISFANFSGYLTNNGTITFSGTLTATFCCGTGFTNNGRINASSGILSISGTPFTASANSSTTLAAITSTDNITLATSSLLTQATDITMTGANTTLTAPTVTLGNVTINKTATTNTLTLRSDIYLSGNWTNTKGILTSTSTTVTFNGTNQSISGSNTFQNLTKQATTSNQTLTFGAGATTTVAGVLTLSGDSTHTLSLRSSTPGTYWGINPQGTRTLSYLDVKDSYNTNATKVDASNPLTFTDSGHNSYWNFGGLFLSTVKDGGAGTTRLWNPISWNQTTPSGSTVVIAVRGGNTATPDGTWTSFTDVANNGSLSAFNSYRYLQYRAILTTTNIDNAASLQDITISYTSYTPEANLVSSPYNTTDNANIVSGISWTESVPTGTTVKFQIRTSPDGSTWTTYRGPDNTNGTYFDNVASGCTKVSTTVTCNITGGQTISDGSNDRYLQYQVTLGSDSSSYSPTVDDVHITYVVNARPDFNVDYPSTNAGGSVASENTDGTVSLGYSVRDADTTTGTYNPGYVIPTFQYSIDGGTNWTSIASTTFAVGNTYPQSVGEVSYTTHSATWDATASIPNTYTTSAQMRVTVNDGEAANNLATSTTASFTLDTKVPTYGSVPLHIDLSSTPANIYLSCSDNSNIEMRIGKVSDLSDATWVAYDATSTLSVSDGETVYAQCRDQYANTAAIQSATAPTQLTGMFYQDISNITPPEYREFVTWGLASEPSLGFSKYNIWRSSDGGSYSLLTSITNRLVNYVVDNGLSTDVNYSYKVTIQDQNGNISKYSSVVSDTPNGVGGTDISKPTISAVVASTTGPTTAVITFTTDKLSNGTISYVATTTYPDVNSNLYTLSQGVPSMVTSHSITVSGLTPNLKYYFFVSATDPSNNTGTSYSSSYYFTTEQGPVISTVSTSKVFPTEATIVWNTNTPADSSVVYSDSTSFSNATTTGSTELVTSHSVTLNNLVAGQKYYYYVKSTDASNNQAINDNVVNGTTEYFNFTATVDNEAPQISSVSTALTGETGAAITWSTNEDSNSTLYYGTTTSLGSTKSNSSDTTEHTIAISDLSANTTYYFKVSSVDKAGNTTTDDNGGSLYSFTTNTPSTIVHNVGGGGGTRTIDNRDLTPPDIDSIKVINITKTSALITLTTSKVTNDIVEYGTTNAYGQQISNEDTYYKNHNIQLSGLKPNTQYHFRVTTADIYKNTTSSSDQVFKTLNGSSTNPTTVKQTSKTIDTNSDDFLLLKSLIKKFTKSNPDSVAETLQSEVESPVITGTEISVDVGSTFATVKWNTDKPANSLVSYAKSSDYNKKGKDYTITSGDPDASTNSHSVLLESLEPGTTYHYQVRSQDLIGPAGVSKDRTFTTSSLSSDISNFKFENVKETEATISWQTSIPTTPILTIVDNKTGKTQVLKDPSFLKDHNFDIKSLKPATSYTVKIESKDEKGTTLSTNTTPFSTVLTKNPPVISNVRVSTSLIPGKEERVQTIVTWNTDKPSTSQIFYNDSLSGDSDLKQSTTIDSGLVQDHIVITTVFKTGKVYKFQVESGDALGKTTRSDSYTVLTPHPKETVVDLIVNNFEDTFGFLKKK